MPDVTPLPEPVDEDEQRALTFIRIKQDTSLRGTPEGDERCDNCHFYVDPDRDVSYCWHDQLEVPAGRDWWCDRWEAIDASEQRPSPDDLRREEQLREHAASVLLAITPKYEQSCVECRYYLNPDDSVSYCWHPKVRIGVGSSWWCQWWDETPGG